MRKTLALCLLLGIILLPATVMAAGAGGQGRIGAQGGNPVLQEQTDETSPAGAYRFCGQHGLNEGQKTGNGEMLRTRSWSGDGEMKQAKTMARNQTRLRDGSCGTCPSL